jgi:hypothetical protein
MLVLNASPVRIAFVVTVVASLGAYGCSGDDDAIPSDDAGVADGTTGTDGGGGTDAGGGSDASDAGPQPDATGNDATTTDSGYCQRLAARAATCDSGAVNDPECHMEEACFDAVLRPAANAPYKGCVTGRACGVSDDTCVVSAAAPFLDAGPYQAYESDCTAKLTACQAQDAGFSDDNCSAVQAALVNDGVFGRLQGCITQACPLVKGCVGAIFVEAGCN